MRITVRQLKRIINEALVDEGPAAPAPLTPDSAGSRLAALYNELSAEYDDEALHLIFSTFASHLDWYGVEAAAGAVEDQLAGAGGARQRVGRSHG